jgi:5-methylcytosine-specific restriction endonuclease McrA
MPRAFFLPGGTIMEDLIQGNEQVLVLNQNYEPLNVCSWRRAVTLVYRGKAIAIEHDGRLLHSQTRAVPLPSVVRLAEQIRRPVPRVKMSRASIMARDDYRCQYCGKRSQKLTVDHVIPRHKGGRHAWENVVACCLDCNNRKGNRTPREAGVTLLRVPKRPRFIPYLSFPTFRRALRNQVWRDYLEPFAPHLLPD